MDNKKATAILAISLMLLQAIVLMLPGIDTAGENQGTASHDGVSVSYIDSSNPGYGILTVSFSDKPGADYFTVSIDGGMTSAPIPVNPGMFAVPGGLSIGTHTLRVVCGDDDWHIAITVAEVIHATGVTIDCTSVPMTVGETIVLKASVVPSDAVEKDIVWNSSNTSVATVSNGTVKAVSAGTAVITASVGDLKATCSISVSDSSHVHTWDSGTVTKKPTCTEPGIKTYKCSCGETRTETIPALGHKWSEWTVVKEATEKEDGLKERTCSVCGEKEQQIIPKIGGHVHTWDSGTVTKEPTCTEPGIKTYTCSCGETRTESIPALGHKWSEWVIQNEPTPTSVGLKYRTCDNCDEVQWSKVVYKGSDPVNINGDSSTTSVVPKGDAWDAESKLSSVIEKDGDAVVVSISSDAITEALDQLTTLDDGNSKVAVTISISIDSGDAKVAELRIRSDDVRRLSDVGDYILRYETSTCRVDIGSGILASLGGEGISLSFSDGVPVPPAMASDIVDGRVIDVTMKSGDSGIHELGGTATVSVPYEIPKSKDPRDLSVWYVDGETLVKVESSYDGATGAVSFGTNHFSQWIIGFEPESDDGYGTIILVAIGILAAIGAVVFLMKRR